MKEKLIKYHDAVRAVKDYWKSEVDKCETQGGMLIDCVEHNAGILQNIDAIPEAEAIPVDYIVSRIRETAGAESSYYSRLLREWRETEGV